MDKTDKPLSEWTVGMVKKLCLERCDCVGCPAYIQDKCVFWKCDNPQAWNVNMTGTDITSKSESSDKPRLAEVLGVEVGQKWRVVCPEEDIDSVEVWLNEKGHLIGETLVAGSVILCAAINHPESIIRAPRLTEPEIAIMRAVGARWASRDDNWDDGSVDLWGAKPLYGDGMLKLALAWRTVKEG